MFERWIVQRKACPACGLDFTPLQAGDGPVPFIILLVGFVVCALALWVELRYSPPYWVHAVLWVPSIVILSIGLLRPIKAALLVLQYKHKAGEARRID